MSFGRELKVVFFFLFFALPSVALANRESAIKPKVVYGADDRHEVFEETDPKRKELARSVAALVPSATMRLEEKGFWTIQSESYREAYNLCPSEKFVEQDIAAVCTAFLVGTDLIATAGHCIYDELSCVSSRFIFDFSFLEPANDLKTAAPSQVYSCKELVAWGVPGTGSDYALIRLDRPVPDRVPLAIRRTGEPEIGEDLFVIGNPGGLPTKIASGAKIRSLSPLNGFANLDTYLGNSGSPIFNAQNEVEGILVSGEVDFTPQGACNVTNQCPDNGCRGEEFTRASQLLPFLPTTQ